MKLLRMSALFATTYIILQLIFSISASFQHSAQTDNAINNIEKRIALDLPKLRLANSKFDIVAHEQTVQDYLANLNEKLKQIGSHLTVSRLQGIESRNENNNGSIILRSLETSDQKIELQLQAQKQGILSSINIFPLLAALFFTFMMRGYIKGFDNRNDLEDQSGFESMTPKLIIDLHQKTLSNNLSETASPLSNKPFCFYIALIEYCLLHDKPYLNHNKDLPDDLLTLANKYFYRLIELGHVIRKRPDFSGNLDKTLSEIRAALDEQFHDFPEVKDMFYPPKAQGEGSRSKLHNYALEHLDENQIEFVGK